MGNRQMDRSPKSEVRSPTKPTAEIRKYGNKEIRERQFEVRWPKSEVKDIGHWTSDIGHWTSGAVASILSPLFSVVVAFFFLLPTPYTLAPTPCLYGESFKILGTRPLSMGGAYTAIAEDALTQYYNPAGLGIGKDVDVQIPVGVKLEATGDILGSADRLSNIADQFSKISNAQKTGGALSLGQLAAFVKGIKELDELNDSKKGLLADVSCGMNVRVGQFAISVNNFTSLGVDPSIDIKNLGLGGGTFSPSLKRAIYKTESYGGVDFGGLSASSTTDPKLQSSADTLAKTIDVLASKAGVDKGGHSSKEIANAIINAATDPTIATGLGIPVLSSDEVISYVGQIEELRGLIDSLLAGGGYSANQSNLTVRGASTIETSLGYGRLAPYLQSDDVLNGFFKGLYIGGNLKYINGYVGYAKANVLSDSDVEPFKDLSDNYKTSNAIGLDIGLLLEKKFFNRKTHFGLLFRNINSPSFAQSTVAITDGESSKYKISPQIRGGVAFWPYNWWTVAMDIDLTKNSTPLPGYDSRLCGIGNEFNLVNSKWFNFAFRCGLMKNLAESSSKLSYTGGFGLTVAHFVIDFGGAMSQDTVEIADGKKVPSSGSSAVTISFDF